MSIILHTNAEKFNPIRTGNYAFHDMVIQKMEAKEQKVYSMLGVSGYQELNQLIRKLGPDILKDLEVFSNRGEKYGLKWMINDIIAASQPRALPIHLNVEFDFSQVDLDSVFRALDGIVVSTGNDLMQLRMSVQYSGKLRMELDKASLKTLVNEITGAHLQVDTQSITQLQKRLVELVNTDTLRFTITDGAREKVVDAQGIKTLVTLQNFPWGLTKSGFDYLKDFMDSAEIDQLIKQNNRDIIEHLKNRLSSPGGKVARIMERILERTFASKDGEYFFAKGGNYMNGVVGALGELQGAIVFELLREELGIKAANLVGDAIMDNGKKNPVDIWVELLEGMGFGIQSKNYFENRTKEVQIPFAKFGFDLQERGSIVNAHFNADIETSEKDIIARHQSELMDYLYNNMDEVGTANTFFLVSGKYLIPTSKLLQVEDARVDGPNPVGTTNTFYMAPKNAYFMEWWTGGVPSKSVPKPGNGSYADSMERSMMVVAKIRVSDLEDYRFL